MSFLTVMFRYSKNGSKLAPRQAEAMRSYFCALAMLTQRGQGTMSTLTWYNRHG